MDYVVEESFFSAYVKESRLDIYSADSAVKAGKFSLDTFIPWLPSLTMIDAMGRSKPYRAIPSNMKYTLDHHAVVYTMLPAEEEEEKKLHRSSVESAPSDPQVVADTSNERPFTQGEISKKDLFASQAEVVWLCPPPRLGGVIFILNYRLKDSQEWKELTYSVKESPLR